MLRMFIWFIFCFQDGCFWNIGNKVWIYFQWRTWYLLMLWNKTHGCTNNKKGNSFTLVVIIQGGHLFSFILFYKLPNQRCKLSNSFLCLFIVFCFSLQSLNYCSGLIQWFLLWLMMNTPFILHLFCAQCYCLQVD